MNLKIGENIRFLRRKAGITQEELAGALNISFQSVSKWERGETLPDLLLLPALANFFAVTTDELLGMASIRDSERRGEVYRAVHAHEQAGEYAEAVALLRAEVKIFPSDAGLMSELALALMLSESECADRVATAEAIELCQRVLAMEASAKLHSTVRAALCFLLRNSGQTDRALALAQKLPHAWECREFVLPEMYAEEKRPAARKAAQAKLAHAGKMIASEPARLLALGTE